MQWPRSSVSSAATPAGASFSWECAQHGDNFGGKLNSLQSRAVQQRSHPYGKTVLAARASSSPAVQGFDDMKSLHHHVPLSGELETLVLKGKAATKHYASKHGCTPCACTPCANFALVSALHIASTAHSVVIFNNKEASATSF